LSTRTTRPDESRETGGGLPVSRDSSHLVVLVDNFPVIGRVWRFLWTR